MSNRTLLVASVLAGLALSLEGQSLNEAFLQSTVLVTFDVDAKRQSFGSGFFVFRSMSNA